MSLSVAPFNEDKYKVLTDRLEVVEIELSHLERTIRIDAEFYEKGNLIVEKTLGRLEKKAFTDCFNISDGNHMSISEEFCDNGIPYYRGQDIYHLFIETSNPLMISKKAFDTPQMKRSYLCKGDVLMSIVGAIIGNSAIVTTDIKATCSCKLAIMRAKNSNILPEVLLVYIKTKYGQNQIQKFKRGAAQTGLLLEDFEQLFIPQFGSRFQYSIYGIIDQIKRQTESANIIYEDACELLLRYLGLDNYVPNSSGISVKSFSESFAISERLDSEYYQPKYEEVLKAISICDIRKLSGANGLVDIRKSIEPGSECYCNEGIPFVRVSNISKYGISTPDVMIPFDVVKNIQELYLKEDTILLSKDGSIGIAYKIEEDMQYVTSGAILHLTVRNKKEVLPDYLALVLNSIIVQMQAERDAGGSIIQHWKVPEITEVIIPVLTIDKQRVIADKVKSSFEMRKKSIELLELAKIAVEMAIEQGEDKAILMLKEGIV